MPQKGPFLPDQLLLDSGSLSGSFFQRTVLLVCRHDAEGAFGLVLNRDTGTKAVDAIAAELPATLQESPLFAGGPVQPTALTYLLGNEAGAAGEILPGLTLGHSLDSLLEVGAGLPPGGRLKLFAGYSGWSPGQLEDEMRRKAWLTHPASLDLVFTPAPGDLWAAILKAKGGFHRLLAQMPEDPGRN